MRPQPDAADPGGAPTHSPGPWTAHRPVNGPWVIDDAEGESFVWVSVLTGPTSDGPMRMDEGRTEANTRLIAQAPAMLTALRRVVAAPLPASAASDLSLLQIDAAFAAWREAVSACREAVGEAVEPGSSRAAAVTL